MIETLARVRQGQGRTKTIKEGEMNSFAQKLKSVREAVGLSQKAFAEQLDIGPVTMNRLEKGNQLPDANVLVGLRNLFDVDLNWILADGRGSYRAPEPQIPVYDDSQLVLPEAQRRRVAQLNMPGVEEGAYAYRVRDEAMMPLVRPGDHVIVQTIEPKLGDLALCQSDTGVIQVRRVSQGDNKFSTVVDNPAYGPTATRGEMTLLGRICRVVRTIEV